MDISTVKKKKNPLFHFLGKSISMESYFSPVWKAEDKNMNMLFLVDWVSGLIVSDWILSSI